MEDTKSRRYSELYIDEFADLYPYEMEYISNTINSRVGEVNCNYSSEDLRKKRIKRKKLKKMRKKYA